MSLYKTTVSWQNSGPDFVKGNYSRVHQWRFSGGTCIDASAAADIVPPPWSDSELVDPEAAFVASLASCHMLFFLHLASRQGFIVSSYQDDAEGYMEKNSQGRMAMTRVNLHPVAQFSGDAVPDRDNLESLHHRAHELCFIANSVLTEVNVVLTEVA